MFLCLEASSQFFLNVCLWEVKLQGLWSHVSFYFLSHKHPPMEPGNYESMLLPKVVKRLMVASVYTICADPDILDLELLIQMQFLLLFMYMVYGI